MDLRILKVIFEALGEVRSSGRNLLTSKERSILLLIQHFFSLKIKTHFSRFKDSLRFGNFFGSFISDFLSGLPVEHSEEIVVGACHNGSIIAIPTTLKLVKNTIIFVQ